MNVISRKIRFLKRAARGLTPSRARLLNPRKAILITFMGLVVMTGPGQAQPAKHQMPGNLTIDIDLKPDGIRLLWVDAKPKFVGAVEISRRRLGMQGVSTWTILSPNAGTVLSYTDKAATPGVAWEYRVRRIGREIVDQGFAAAGRDLPAIDYRGTALMIVDETLVQDMSVRLDRFQTDLIADGWTVSRLTAPSMRDIEGDRMATLARAQDLKTRILLERTKHQGGEFAIILIGRLPMVRSGEIAPDGHDRRAFGTDLYYGDIGRDWPAKPDGTLIPSIMPDGHLDVSIGRIDFVGLAPVDKQRELKYLRDYFDNNHAWRHGKWGDPREAYAGARGQLMVETSGLVNISGADAVSAGKHNETDMQKRWLWGIDFGHHDVGTYFSAPIAKPVFALNFGSNKLAIDRPANAMNAMLASPNQTLAVAWGSRPAWRVHGMSVGETIGAAQLRTVNNGPEPGAGRESIDYLPTGLYLFFYPIWGNLLGDPTLHAFPLRPASKVRAKATDDTISLSWTESPEPGATYRVYRENPAGAFEQIGPDQINGTTFIDVAPTAGDPPRYMVRTLLRKIANAASMDVLSQGVLTPNSATK